MNKKGNAIISFALLALMILTYAAILLYAPYKVVAIVFIASGVLGLITKWYNPFVAVSMIVIGVISFINNLI